MLRYLRHAKFIKTANNCVPYSPPDENKIKCRIHSTLPITSEISNIHSQVFLDTYTLYFCITCNIVLFYMVLILHKWYTVCIILKQAFCTPLFEKSNVDTIPIFIHIHCCISFKYLQIVFPQWWHLPISGVSVLST